MSTTLTPESEALHWERHSQHWAGGCLEQAGSTKPCALVLALEAIERAAAERAVARVVAALEATLHQLEVEHGHSSDSDAGWPACAIVHPVIEAAYQALEGAGPAPETGEDPPETDDLLAYLARRNVYSAADHVLYEADLILAAIDRLAGAGPAREAPPDEHDAARYRRLRILGAAPLGTSQLDHGTVLRFTNLDGFVDNDLMSYPSRGEFREPGAAPPAGDEP